MKLFFKYITTSIALILAFALTSCHKKWKKPTDVSFRFQLNQNSNAGLIKFNHASLVLTKIYVSADRKQSPPHVYMQRSVNEKSDFFINSPSQAYRFDIPQGTYSSFNFKYETSNDENVAGLEVDGSYTDSSGATFAVQFVFSAGYINNLMAKNGSGANEITLVEGHSANGTVYLNPTYWFAPITGHIMNDADIETINGVPTILIDEDSNDGIYELVISRINDGNDCVIK
ncbi:MAG: hypothetical protein ACXVC6_07275 [Bacteroidia bacterium]